MTKRNYHRQAVDMLGWTFGWYKYKSRHYIVPDGFEIHHIDGDWTNNSLDNLAILTVEEHIKIHDEDRIKYGKINGKIGGKKTAEKVSKPVLCVETCVIYESVREASRQTGIDKSHICKVCSKKPMHKTAGGFHWQYVEEGDK